MFNFNNVRRRLLTGLCLTTLALTPLSAIQSQAALKYPGFKRIPTQFIAALGDEKANSGSGAQTWGHWPYDPGPRGIWLSLFKIVNAAGGFAPSGWQFDEKDWWLDENGLIMEKPSFPLAPGKYLVTGEREVTTTLTVHENDADGNRRWELGDNAKLLDVTHLPCRSSRYTPLSKGAACSPASVDRSIFRIEPGTKMPSVQGCHKQDYAVLFVIGVAE